MATVETVDAIILGTGQAGKPLATALAGAGLRTVMIESRHVGGTCINTGCTPTKTMVASARAAWMGRRLADYGVHAGAITVNMQEIRARKDAVVADFRDRGAKRLLHAANLELLFGTARFSGERQVTVDLNAGGDRTFTAERIFINTGARSAVPVVAGLDSVPLLDNVSVMELDAVPQHLLVLGGGYIGVEFAQMFRRFGSEVTIVQSAGQLLPREDADIAAAVRAVLAQDGVRVLTGSRAVRAQMRAGSIHLQLTGADDSVEGSHLLLATGRVPNTEELNLAKTGVETDSHGYIRVKETLETNVNGIYALGDVKGGPAFTHISYDDYRVVAANVLEGHHRTITGRMVPYTVFLDPQLGRIGMTEADAREAGLHYRVASMPMASVARAIEVGETRGLMKIVVDAGTEQILGAAIFGIEGGEVASMLQIAMMGKLPYTALRDAIFAHPLLAEALNNIFFAFRE